MEGSAYASPVDWRAALREHERWLRTILFARLWDREAVEDALQEVALAAVKQQAPLTDPSKAAPWLYRLAVRQALLARRKAGRRKNLTERFAEARQPSEADERAPDPLDWLLAEERRTLVRQALARLPERDAEILLLKYTENWSYQQIAQRLDVSTSAVEARLHRARAKMRTELAALQVTEAG